MRKFFKYQENHLDFMRLHKDKRPADMYALFVAEFGNETKFESFKTTLYRYKIRGGERVKYTHNGHFKKGVAPPTEKQIGEVVFRNQGLYVKVSSVGKQNHRWKLLSHQIWEAANGKIPDAHVLLHLDGNKRNCELSNLVCVSIKVHCVMQRELKDIDSSLVTERIKLAEAILAAGDFRKRRKYITNE